MQNSILIEYEEDCFIVSCINALANSSSYRVHNGMMNFNGFIEEIYGADDSHHSHCSRIVVVD